jgi:hypothetical protein
MSEKSEIWENKPFIKFFNLNLKDHHLVKDNAVLDLFLKDFDFEMGRYLPKPILQLVNTGEKYKYNNPGKGVYKIDLMNSRYCTSRLAKILEKEGQGEVVSVCPCLGKGSITYYHPETGERLYGVHSPSENTEKSTK